MPWVRRSGAKIRWAPPAMIASRHIVGMGGVMLRVLGAALAAILIVGCSASTIGPAPRTEPAPPEDPSVSDPEPTADADDGLSVNDVAMPKTFKEVSKRGWAQIVKAPDKQAGKGFKIWACIFQFDAATGDDGFLGNASYKKQEYWGLYGDNAAFVGDPNKLADVVEGDIVTMNVAMIGSYSYDTQAGGNTTVPAFRVVTIKRQKGDCG